MTVTFALVIPTLLSAPASSTSRNALLLFGAAGRIRTGLALRLAISHFPPLSGCGSPPDGPMTRGWPGLATGSSLAISSGRHKALTSRDRRQPRPRSYPWYAWASLRAHVDACLAALPNAFCHSVCPCLVLPPYSVGVRVPTTPPQPCLFAIIKATSA